MSHFRSLLVLASLGLTLAACDAASDVEAAASTPANASFNASSQGGVFVLSDAAGANEVVAFRRAADGTLQSAGTFATGGEGSGGGLGAATDPVVLSPDGRFLYAVNRGSDDVSVFQVTGNRLQLREVVASGGDAPISIAVSGDLLYVLNTGTGGVGGTVAAFARRPNGRLQALGARALPAAAAGPTQVSFDPSRRTAVVTDRPSNTILVYPVMADGTPGEPTVNASVGQTPFGFDFDAAGRLYVSEAVGGAPDASTVSGYTRSGTTTSVISGAAAVPTEETAACWLDTAGRYLYTTNTGSASISGFLINADGSLALLDADGVTAVTGTNPRDLNTVGRYLYAQSDGQIDVFRIAEGGALESVQTVAVPATARGVAAR